MARLDETISAGQAGHISDSQILARKANYVYDVMDYGATGDGVADDSTAIQSAIVAAEAASPVGTVYFPPKIFKIDTGLTVLDCNIDAARNSALLVDDLVAVGITVGSAASSCNRHTLVFPDISPETRDWDSTPTIGTQRGLLFKAADSCIVTVGNVQDFSYGLVLEGDAQGVAYNTFTLTALLDNAIQIYLTSISAGWSNQNTFIGGRISVTDIGGTPPYAGTRQIKIESNNNTFVGVSLEGDIFEHAVECDGTFNMWINCRWEGATPSIEFTANAWRNTIDGGFDSFALTVTADAASRYNSILAPGFWKIEGSDSTGAMKVSNTPTNARGISFYDGDEPLANKADGEYLVSLSAAALRAKSETDTYDKFYLNNALGRIYLGDGSSDPTSNGYLRHNAGFFEFTGPLMVESGSRIFSGSATPEGAQTGPVGSLFLRTDGGAGTSMYVKEVGTGSTGWVAK